jgi:hypothetical protein
MMAKYRVNLLLPVTTIILPTALLLIAGFREITQANYELAYDISLFWYGSVTLLYPYIVFKSTSKFNRDVSDKEKWGISVLALLLGAIPLGQVLFSFVYTFIVYPSETSPGT